MPIRNWGKVYGEMSIMYEALEVGYSEVGCKKRGYSIVRTLTWKLFGHRMFVKKNFYFVS